MKFFDPRGDIEKTAHKLPHWQQGEVAILVTFRLADSLPRELLDDWLRSHLGLDRRPLPRLRPGPLRNCFLSRGSELARLIVAMLALVA